MVTDKSKTTLKTQVEVLTQRVEILETQLSELRIQNESMHREMYTMLAMAVDEVRRELIGLQTDVRTEQEERRKRASRAKRLFESE